MGRRSRGNGTRRSRRDQGCRCAGALGVRASLSRRRRVQRTSHRVRPAMPRAGDQGVDQRGPERPPRAWSRSPEGQQHGNRSDEEGRRHRRRRVAMSTAQAASSGRRSGEEDDGEKKTTWRRRPRRRGPRREGHGHSRGQEAAAKATAKRRGHGEGQTTASRSSPRKSTAKQSTEKKSHGDEEHGRRSRHQEAGLRRVRPTWPVDDRSEQVRRCPNHVGDTMCRRTTRASSAHLDRAGLTWFESKDRIEPCTRRRRAASEPRCSARLAGRGRDSESGANGRGPFARKPPCGRVVCPVRLAEDDHDRAYGRSRIEWWRRREPSQSGVSGSSPTNGTGRTFGEDLVAVDAQPSE